MYVDIIFILHVSGGGAEIRLLLFSLIQFIYLLKTYISLHTYSIYKYCSYSVMNGNGNGDIFIKYYIRKQKALILY